MKNFNVIVWDINRRQFTTYDVIPYLIQQYNETKKMDSYKKTPETFEEFKKFVDKESMYQWWSRCEYEIILQDWPGQTKQEKVDVYWQIKNNLDLVTEILINAINERNRDEH